MKQTNQILVLLSSLVCLGLSASAFGSPQSPRGDLPDDPPIVSEPELPVTPPLHGTEYTMRMVTPSPHIDYKIGFVIPDPSINYTIRNVRPELGNPFIRGNGPGNCRPK